MKFLILFIISRAFAVDIAVVDNFDTKKSHGYEVVEVLKKNYQGPITTFNTVVKNDFKEELYLEALEKVLSTRPSILNLSLGGGAYIYEEVRLIRAIADAGTLIVVAAGNGNQKLKGIDAVYPCNIKHENIFCVGASSENKKAELSNYGGNVRFFMDGTYKNKNMTSFSAPKVSALLSKLIGCGLSLDILNESPMMLVDGVLRSNLTSFDVEDWCYRPRVHDPF